MTRALGLVLRSGGAAAWAWLALFVAVAGCSELKVYRGDAADAAPADAGDVGLDAAPADAGDASVDASEAASEDAGDAMPDADADDADDAEDADAGEADAAEVGCDGGAERCGAACIDLSASVAHCGRCDNACPTRANAAATCVMGACGAACNAGFADCDGDAGNGCEASLESAAHCGRCGARCEGMTPLCGTEGGERRCVDGCAAGEVLCSGACATTASSEVHCGRCGNACPMGAMCVMGACACPSGQSDCGGACAATGADCTVGRGACMRTGTVICAAMGAGTQCSARPGAAGAETCNGLDDDCDGAVDGAAAAAACPARANAMATCAMGACGYACAAGFGDCDGDASNGCENPGPCTPCTEGWRPIADGPAVWGASCAWTGKELLVWGGSEGTTLSNRGWRYDARVDRWTPMAMSPLAPRAFHHAVWTGVEYVIWGGAGNGAVAFADGARYDPSSDRWMAMSPAAALVARNEGAVAWTGTSMLVWGGGAPTARTPTDSGGSYSLVTNRWDALPALGAPGARQAPAGVWTGDELLVWGGQYFDGSRYVRLNDGARFNPMSGRWSPMSSVGAPEGRAYVSVVWTGAEALLWGGHNGSAAPLATGARYSPATDRWTPMSARDAPPARGQAGAVWTGTEMVVFGGNPISPGYLADSYAYNPTADTWRRLPEAMLGQRAFNCIAWTGGEVIVQGGADQDGGPMMTWRNGARYTPPGLRYPRMSCSGRCVDASADPLHCGACGNECAAPANATATCARSRCAFVCNAGFADCDGSAANGCEVDLRTSAAHCGACDARCEAGHQCVSAECLAPRMSCPVLSERGCGAVVVRGGTFTLGQSGARGSREPSPGVTVSDFELDVAKVTVARFRRYWSAGHPDVPGNRVSYREGVDLAWDGAVREPLATTALAECNWSSAPATREGHPINCIDWYTAQAFCVWDGGRLPTEAEWEYAARTSMNFTYPWGEDPPGARACWSGVTARSGTCAVGEFPAIRRLFDLSGNLLERVADADDDACWASGFRMRNPLCASRSTTARAYRGGAYDSTSPSWMRGASRGSDPATGQDRNAGFRCAR